MPSEPVPEVAKDARWDPALEDLVGYDYGEAWLTPLFIYGTNLALPGAAMLWLLFSLTRLAVKRRRARRTERDAKARELSAGPAVLHGVVREVDNAEGVAVRLEIEQLGTSYKPAKSDNWRTRWTEVDRKLKTAPFILETAAGRVRVEPDAGVFLVDDLEAREREGHTRVRFAEVREGDELFASGRLEEIVDAQLAAGYRRAGRGWALRPARDGHMMLSSKPLSAAYDHHAGTRRAAFLALFAVVAFAQMLALSYHRARAAAEDEAAVVISRCDYPGEKQRHYYFARYKLLRTGEVTETRVNQTDYERMPVGTVVPVNVLRGSGAPRVTLGRGASTLVPVSLIPMAVVVATLFLCAMLIRRSRPWWERKQLVDDVSGKLAE